ncbi:hypothetical protein BH11MYX4_BH11MYX4_60100 [soil metagenome]
MRIPTKLLFPTLGAILQVACIDAQNTSSSSASSSGSTGTAAEGGAATAAGQACLDTADAFAKAQVRCGAPDYATARAAVIRDLANGDCESVTIRNESELRRGCLPALGTISCADLTNQRFPPACAEQIVRLK